MPLESDEALSTIATSAAVTNTNLTGTSNEIIETQVRQQCVPDWEESESSAWWHGAVVACGWSTSGESGITQQAPYAITVFKKNTTTAL